VNEICGLAALNILDKDLMVTRYNAIVFVDAEVVEKGRIFYKYFVVDKSSRHFAYLSRNNDADNLRLFNMFQRFTIEDDDNTEINTSDSKYRSINENFQNGKAIKILNLDENQNDFEVFSIGEVISINVILD